MNGWNDTHSYSNLNLFLANAPILNPLKKSRKSKIFLRFQEAQNGSIGKKWVKIALQANYSVSLRIQSKCRKTRTRITPITDTFHAV